MKAYLETFPSGSLRRVTFVLFNDEHYKVFQEALFATFPEED